MARDCKKSKGVNLAENSEPEMEVMGGAGIIEWGAHLVEEIEGARKEKEESVEILTVGERGACEVNQRLEPNWRKKIQGGYRLTLVMDSGAVKTIMPPESIPGMVVKRTRNTGKTFRVANGQEIPNEGETKIVGKSIEGQAMAITAQVAGITKPLAAANEMVDAGNWVIMHSEGGAIQRLTESEKNEIRKILEKSKGPRVPIVRQAGAFTIEMEIEAEDDDGFQRPKRTAKTKAIKSNDMDVDAIVKGAWEAFWECRESEEESCFHRHA